MGKGLKKGFFLSSKATQLTRALPAFPYDGYEFVEGPRLTCLPFSYIFPRDAGWREEVDAIVVAFREAGLDQKSFYK